MKQKIENYSFQNQNEKFLEANAQILSLQVGQKVWNVCGLDEVVEIHAKGISSVDGAAYVCFYTKFGANGGKMSGSIRANSLEFKDGFMIDRIVQQWVQGHKAENFQ